MKQLDINEVVTFVEEKIPAFHEKRLENLSKLRLKTILKRKNPYLFKAKHVETAEQLVRGILDAHLSSQEETVFGNFMEELAIFVCQQVYSGHKSSAEGIDLEFTKNNILYIVSIKSGPNWGNSSQIARMKNNFKQAKRRLQQNPETKPVIAINGCCYGKDENPDKGDYQKLCGQRFWHFISDNENLYIDLIAPLGHKAKQKNDDFHKAYIRLVNLFSQEFMNEFYDDGQINWEKFVKFNAAWKKNTP